MDQPQSVQIYLIIAIGIVTMLVMAGAIIIFVVFYQKKMIQEQMKRQALEFEYQQKMLEAELQSQESERRRLAADLHDSIGGMLSTIRVGITTIAKKLPEPGQVDQTKQMLDDTISSVRRISRDLMPSTLEKFGLLNALTELCERFQATSGIVIHFTEEGSYQTMDKNRELMVFRIVQELINNAIKHAQASEINVTLSYQNNLAIIVEDNGIGFDAEAFINDKTGGKGLGLFNIENRARLLSGRVEYDKERRKGSKTVLTIPVGNETIV
ncbi:sensor histidine kinase [Chryseosolibacter indicus]|uniref:Oxygen sensor histidine kinase NreB n=1 Tax=Chryseosolibacter indicus TaxID=2782351 RepID=A0ABS5VY20_9BACT|nr:sensor histidine kinase [Chryseosolibacter indicus]MBT1706191.1 sensor histidine kinase [Chryseosolibacter indicus]